MSLNCPFVSSGGEVVEFANEHGYYYLVSDTTCYTRGTGSGIIVMSLQNGNILHCLQPETKLIAQIEGEFKARKKVWSWHPSRF
jgi:hypothetical protein